MRTRRYIARRAFAAAAAGDRRAARVRSRRSAATPTAITGPVTSITGPRPPRSAAPSTRTAPPPRWHFEYGKTTSYGTSTRDTNAGSGTANTGVSASLTGLTPGTTYHYRLVATSNGGTTNGADGIFNTARPPRPRPRRRDLGHLPPRRSTARSTRTARRRPTTSSTARRRPTGRRRRSQNAGSDTAPVTVSAVDLGARERADLPLPPRRDERRRDDARQRHDLQRSRRRARR